MKKEPRPFVLQMAFSDFYVDYQLNAYLEEPQERVPTPAALHANIQDAFKEKKDVDIKAFFLNIGR